MDIQKEILSLINANDILDKQINTLEEQKETNNVAIGKFTRSLLNNLKLIDGWEILIKNCKDHYHKYPDSFFGWCKVKYENDCISFMKYYSDGDVYEVLRLDLNIPLEKQVSNVIKEITDKEKSLEEREKTIRREQYLKLKEEFENE